MAVARDVARAAGPGPDRPQRLLHCRQDGGVLPHPEIVGCKRAPQNHPRADRRPHHGVPIDPAHAALLIIDVQNYCAGTEAGKTEYFHRSLRGTVVPNIRRLQTACRSGGIEVMYSVIENITRDGRDRSLDYKISGIDVQRGSWDAQVVDEIAPAEDEMIFRKTSSSVFISTNIDYVLRNLGARSLIITGIMTDQCVESTVRDACDLGYLVTSSPMLAPPPAPSATNSRSSVFAAIAARAAARRSSPESQQRPIPVDCTGQSFVREARARRHVQFAKKRARKPGTRVSASCRAAGSVP
jgi:ureidoacrylate peracid hydrolase